MSSQLKRNYNGSDSYMVEQSGIGKALLSQDIAPFTAFDSTINAAFATAMAAKVQAAFSVVRDDQAIAPQLAETQVVLTAMKVGENLYADTMYFVTHKAFKGDKAIAREFGKNAYVQAHRSQPSFSVFLNAMYLTSMKYKVKLIAAGNSQAAIDSILVAADNLHVKDINQEVLKRGRPVLTADRITVLNDWYSDLKVVQAAAQQVYRDDVQKKNQFVYRPGSSSVGVTDVALPIGAHATVTVFNNPYDGERTVTLRALLTALTFGLSADGVTIIGTTISVPVNGVVIKKCSELNTEGDLLICINTTGVAGSFDVEVDR